METFSVLSKASYDYTRYGLEKAQQELKDYGSNYTIVKGTRNAVVLKNGGSVVISYRGTDLKNPSDLLADTEILLGRDKLKIFLNDRFDEADKLYLETKKEYPKSDITLTGHSLGSAQAIYVGTKNNVKSVSFNEGTSPLDVLFSRFGNSEKQTVYVTGKDILSNLSILEPYDVKYVPTKSGPFVSHSLNYFLPEKKGSVVSYLEPMYQPKYKPKKGVTQDTYGLEYFKDLALARKRRAPFDKRLQLGLYG